VCRSGDGVGMTSKRGGCGKSPEEEEEEEDGVLLRAEALGAPTPVKTLGLPWSLFFDPTGGFA
jgi:hypothetical protein